MPSRRYRVRWGHRGGRTWSSVQDANTRNSARAWSRRALAELAIQAGDRIGDWRCISVYHTRDRAGMDPYPPSRT